MAELEAILPETGVREFRIENRIAVTVFILFA